ncbi:hypothetical protein VHP8226_03380 [Vibrio hippocampi]|uniref:Conjugal transfer protein TraF n=2 Tax=Vibrio hippocampi TaxID=654686 RepID=A0ABN8DKG9_9VIBR|nr:hypothetical protein VHP8226_03380 [Vibrio hippocampi]
MGGVGVVSASYLTAPFYNPALVAIYRRNDDAGMLLPSLGINYDDQNGLIDQVDQAVATGDISAISNDSVANLDFGGAVAFGLPNRFVAANIFGKAYVENVAQPDMGSTVTNSAVKSASVAITEIGLSLAKYQTVLGQHWSFGVTPKFQRIYTFTSVSSLQDFALENVTDNKEGESAFNIDAGALWFFGPFRAGVSATNLLSRNIKTAQGTTLVGGRAVDYGYEYNLEPLYTVGAGYVADYFQFSIDYDLNKETKFTQFDDDTQMIRAGLEVDLIRQIQLRAGYYKNLAKDNSDGTITAGIGLTPLNLIEMDISARYTNADAMGASINFVTTY